MVHLARNVHCDPGGDHMFQNFETATRQRHGSIFFWHRGVAKLEDGRNNAELQEWGDGGPLQEKVEQSPTADSVHRERARRISEKLNGASSAPAARGGSNKSENLVTTYRREILIKAATCLQSGCGEMLSPASKRLRRCRWRAGVAIEHCGDWSRLECLCRNVFLMRATAGRAQSKSIRPALAYLLPTHTHTHPHPPTHTHLLRRPPAPAAPSHSSFNQAVTSRHWSFNPATDRRCIRIHIIIIIIIIIWTDTLIPTFTFNIHTHPRPHPPHPHHIHHHINQHSHHTSTVTTAHTTTHIRSDIVFASEVSWPLTVSCSTPLSVGRVYMLSDWISEDDVCAGDCNHFQFKLKGSGQRSGRRSSTTKRAWWYVGVWMSRGFPPPGICGVGHLSVVWSGKCIW